MGISILILGFKGLIALRRRRNLTPAQSFLRSCARSLIWVPNELSNYRKCILNFSSNLIGKSGTGMRLFSSRNPESKSHWQGILNPQRRIQSRIHPLPGLPCVERAIGTKTKPDLRGPSAIKRGWKRSFILS